MDANPDDKHEYAFNLDITIQADSYVQAQVRADHITENVWEIPYVIRADPSVIEDAE